MMQDITIGQLARETGCKIPTIRYYEQIGLLPQPRRTAGNTRRYEANHVARLGFIQHCRELGFAQNAIRELLALTDQPDEPCEAVTKIAETRLADVKRRLARLEALKSELERMIGTCAGGRVKQCRIIEALAH
ncbi:MAG: helix-turn-helix domain-containing protein [Alphaproteobacteria bacterium]|nr:helix-turn-helix domain-containing protein [Alphaproteobacteria bacterium]